MTCFHQDLGLPGTLISELVYQTDAQGHAQLPDLSPTLPYEVDGLARSMPCSAPEDFPSQGLTARFLLKFARDMLENFQTNVQPNQVQILCLDAHADTLRECRVQPWAVGTAPLYLFVLVNQHRTFVTCFVSAGRLVVQHSDGLTHTSLCALAPLCHRLKAAWQVESVTLTTSWRIEVVIYCKFERY